jgi:tetratricopeptide (TPR) repeat protein
MFTESLQQPNFNKGRIIITSSNPLTLPLMKKTIILLVLFTATCFSVAAQQQDAKTLDETGKTFMRDGDYANAIIVFNNALKQEPDNLEILKDIAFTYYLQKDFIKALAVAKSFPERKDADVQSYQILALIYKITDERKECEKLYKDGIKKFPKSGVLYSEYAEVIGTKDGGDAILLWEKGIEVDPNYSGNYSNACKYYYSKSEFAWSILYGEIFVNIESYSKRTAEIKDLVEDGYKQLFANIEAQKKKEAKNPFITAYLNTLANQSSSIAQGITPLTLSVLRARFVPDWFEKYAAKFPFRLFDYHQQLIKSGMFDAYNQWIFGETDNSQTFETWTNRHSDEYKKFTTFQSGRIFKLPEGQYYQSH